MIAAALIGHTSRMLLGSPPDGPGAATALVRTPVTAVVAFVGGLLACAALGVAAEPLQSLLRLAAETLTRTTP